MPLWMMMTVILMLFFSRQAMDAALQTADVFCRSVMPALFPMMVLSGLFHPKNTVQKSEYHWWFEQIMFGFCAGSPASARQLAGSINRHILPVNSLEPLICMSGVMSPLFFTGSLAGRVGDQAAWLLLVCHWLTALLTGVICIGWQKLRKQNPSICHSTPVTLTAERPSLPSAISSAASALLSVLGAMMLFAIASALSKAVLSHLFPRWTAANPLLLAILWALLEIGGGTFALLDTVPHPPLWLLCALCSMGGMSIWLQNLLFLGNMIRPVKLILWRMLHGALAGLCCYLLMPFATVSAASIHGMLTLPGPYWLMLVLLTALAWYRPSA